MNFLMLCIGLAICFGGIYIRKAVAGLLGLVWGALFGFMLVIMMALTSGSLYSVMRSSQDDSSMIVVIICAIVVCALSIILERLCAAINAFIGSFILMFLIFAFLAEDIEALEFILILTFMLAIAVAVVAYIYYKYAFIIVTAFSGAFIATLAGIGLTSGTEFSDVLLGFIFASESEDVFVVYVITLVLGMCGFFVQSRGLKDHPAGNHTSNTYTGSGSMSGKIVGNMMGQIKSTMPGTGRASGSVVGNLGAQIKGAWEEICTTSGRKELIDSVMECKWLFVPALVQSIGMPILYRVMIDMYVGSIYVFLEWMNIILGAMVLGVLVYFVLEKDTKLNLIYQMIYVVGYVVFHISSFQYSSAYEIILTSAKYLIIWLVLYVATVVIRKDTVKPILLAVLAFFLSEYLLSWITWRYVHFYMDIYELIKLVVVVGTVFLLFQKCQGINIFGIQGAYSSQSAGDRKRYSNDANVRVLRKCCRCQKIYTDGATYCQNCGIKLDTICPHCGEVVSESSYFCDYCGKHL